MSRDDRGGTVVAVLNHTQHRARNLQSSQQTKHTLTIFAQVLLSSHPCVVQIMEPSETSAFNADFPQLMSLIVNTFYSNKEVFLRGLTANPSDALDKIRNESITDPSEDRAPAKLTPHKTNSSITIEDCGIGVTKNELECNRQVWYQGFHGGLQCRGRHVHDRTRSV